MVVANYSKDQDLALEFIKLITSDEEQQTRNVFGGLPVTTSASRTPARATPSWRR